MSAQNPKGEVEKLLNDANWKAQAQDKLRNAEKYLLVYCLPDSGWHMTYDSDILELLGALSFVKQDLIEDARDAD